MLRSCLIDWSIYLFILLLSFGTCVSVGLCFCVFVDGDWLLNWVGGGGGGWAWIDAKESERNRSNQKGRKATLLVKLINYDQSPSGKESQILNQD